jgi:hypothetical protein
MTPRILIAGVTALFAITACAKADRPAGADATATPPVTDRARSAALTANAIAARPAAADSILAAGGYTPDGFQRLMYEIAADPAMSATYASVRVR